MGFLWTALLALGGIGVVIGSGRVYFGLQRRRQRAAYPRPESLVIDPPDEVTLTRQADGAVTIRWQGIAHQAQAYVGPAPEAIDHTASAAAGTDTDQLTIPDLPPAPRSYIELVRDAHPALIAAERVLPLAGIANLRDIGGYRTQDGRSLRWGRVYRAGTLAGATESDLAYLQALGVRMVCDFRSADEVADDPDRLPQNPAPVYRPMPLTTAEQTNDRLRSVLMNPRRLQDLMEETYTRHMIDENAPVFGAALRLMADPANLPILIHCTAGKDRTGVTIALLLAALGVPDDVIVADYTLSNRSYQTLRAFLAAKVKQPQALILGLSVDDFQPLLMAHPQTMRVTLAHIRQRYGTVEAYLAQQAGVGPDVIAALKANLLD